LHHFEGIKVFVVGSFLLSHTVYHHYHQLYTVAICDSI